MLAADIPHPQHRAAQHSNLTHSLQLQAACAGFGGVPAGTALGVPAGSVAAGLPGQPAPFYPGSWQAFAQAAQAQQQSAAASALSLHGGRAAPPPHASAAAPAPWHSLHPHAGDYQLFQGPGGMSRLPMGDAATQQPAQAEQPAAAAGPADAQAQTRRVRRRRPTARRSLLNLFDAAAASEEASEVSYETDSDCDMNMSSQDSGESCATQAAFPGAFAASPGTPFSNAAAHGDALPSPHCVTPSQGGGSLRNSPMLGDRLGSGAACMSGGPAAEPMLPLQHLLMSERAQRLSALEVKAIVYKVAADLAELHDAGILHRHVTIASVALSRSGNLATARLMGHPYNVASGPGRRYTGGKKAGVDAYLAPELARCPADCVAYTPAGDMWSLGIVLFVLLSGSHVPFGNRGLCWTSIPNMPGPQDSVDKLQHWLEEHLVCKLSVINQLKLSQEKGKAPLGAGPEMRVVGLDDAACDLLLRLLAADPAARPTARQVVHHPWLSEVEGLIPSPHAAQQPPADTQARCPAVPSPGFHDRLQRTATDLASLGFSPATPHEGAAPPAAPRRTLRRISTRSSVCSADSQLDWQAADPSRTADPTARPSAWPPAPAAAPPATSAEAPHARTLVLAGGSTLQLLPPETEAALVAGGVLPQPGGPSATGYKTLGYAVQPVEVEVEGRRSALCALHAVFDVDGQPMLCAQPVTVTQQLPLLGAPSTAASIQPSAPAPAPAGLPCWAGQAPRVSANPDVGTSAPILPLLSRMLQQQHANQ